MRLWLQTPGWAPWVKQRSSHGLRWRGGACWEEGAGAPLNRGLPALVGDDPRGACCHMAGTGGCWHSRLPPRRPDAGAQPGHMGPHHPPAARARCPGAGPGLRRKNQRGEVVLGSGPHPLRPQFCCLRGVSICPVIWSRVPVDGDAATGRWAPTMPLLGAAVAECLSWTMRSHSFFTMTYSLMAAWAS